MVIDFHTHCFPDFLAKTAIEQLSIKCKAAPHFDGTLSGLKKIMEEDGVDVSCVMNIATNPKQMHNVNDFAISINKDNIVSFGSVHPDASDALEELERIKAAGLKGVKFHPDYQNFYPDEDRMKPIYKKIESLGLITLFHAGKDYGFPGPYKCLPDNILSVIKIIDSPVVAAHWGGIGYGEEVLEKLCGTPIFIDTALGYNIFEADFQNKLIEKHGADRVLFASDNPWHRPGLEKKNLEDLGISKTEFDKIMYKNAASLLGL